MSLLVMWTVYAVFGLTLYSAVFVWAVHIKRRGSGKGQEPIRARGTESRRLVLDRRSQFTARRRPRAAQDGRQSGRLFGFVSSCCSGKGKQVTPGSVLVSSWLKQYESTPPPRVTRDSVGILA